MHFIIEIVYLREMQDQRSKHIQDAVNRQLIATASGISESINDDIQDIEVKTIALYFGLRVEVAITISADK